MVSDKGPENRPKRRDMMKNLTRVIIIIMYVRNKWITVFIIDLNYQEKYRGVTLRWKKTGFSWPGW